MIVGPVHVLLVDDQEELVEHLTKRLESRGVSVVGVFNGADAIREAEKGEFDVAVVDLHMPELGGLDTLRELKRRHPTLQVIMLTGFGSSHVAFESGRLDAFRYLDKPVPFLALFDAILDAAEARRELLDDEA